MTWTPISSGSSGALRSATSFTDGATTELVVDTCEATTGWTVVNGSALTTSTAFFTTGTKSVQAKMIVHQSTSKFYKNLSADQSTSGRDRLLVDFNYNVVDGASMVADRIWEFKVASAVDLGGTVVTVPVPRGFTNYVNSTAWVTIIVPLDTLTTIRSFGFTATAGEIDPQNGGAHSMRVDNVRLAAVSKLDQAYDASANVFVPADYTTSATQGPRHPSDIAELDLRPGREHIGRLGGTRHIREWGIPDDGLTECATSFAAAINEAAQDRKLELTAGGYYWLDTPVTLDQAQDFEIDGQGATLFTRYWRGNVNGGNGVVDDMLNIDNSRRVTVGNLQIFMYRDIVTTGDGLTSSGGSPTTVSTTKTLTAAADAVRAIDRGAGGNQIPPFYARYPKIMFPSAVRTMIDAYDPTFVFGNAFVAKLSDSAQVTDDCVFELIDAIDGATVLASRTLTLTSTPTDYLITFAPTDIHRNYKVQIRKATATSNTITVTSLTEYGPVAYSGSHDSADAIRLNNSQDIKLHDISSEGVICDTIDIADDAVTDVEIRRVTVRAASRQGVSFNGCSRVSFQDFKISECARTGIDIEPYTEISYVKDLTIANGEIRNVVNYAVSGNNWSNIKNLTVHDVFWDGCGVQGFTGGARGAYISNIGGKATNLVYTTPSSDTIDMNGVDMRVRGLVADANISIGSTARIASDDVAGAFPATVDTTADTVTLTGTPFYVADDDHLFVHSTLAPGGLGNGDYYVVGTPTYSTTFQLASTVGGTAKNITTSGTAVTVQRLLSYTPSNNDIEGKCIGDYYGKVGSAGRANQLRVQPQGAVRTITSGTIYVGEDIPQDNTGSFELNKQSQWPRSHGRRLASELPTIIGGPDFNGQALRVVRSLNSDSRTVVTMLASSARTTGATTSATDLGARGKNARLTIPVSATSGTTVELRFTIEVSQDNTNWYTLTTLGPMTATNQASIPLRNLERYIRLTYTITGSSPSFTFSAVLDYAANAGNNLAGVKTLGSGVTTGTVTYPTPSIYPTTGTSLTLTAASGGTLSGTYYYRVGARSRRAGPSTWVSEHSFTVNGDSTHNAIDLNVFAWHNTPGVFTEGVSILRGTSAGTYDTRYDVLAPPNVQLFHARNNNAHWVDHGTNVVTADTVAFPAFKTTYPTVGGPYAAVDESGWEPDVSYRVIVTPSWLTTIAVTAKRVDGFDMSFGTATPDANQYVDWMVVR